MELFGFVNVKKQDKCCLDLMVYESFRFNGHKNEIFALENGVSLKDLLYISKIYIRIISTTLED